MARNFRIKVVLLNEREFFTKVKKIPIRKGSEHAYRMVWE